MLPNSNQISNVTKVFSKKFHNLIWRFLIGKKKRNNRFLFVFFPIWRNVGPPEKKRKKKKKAASL